MSSFNAELVYRLLPPPLWDTAKELGHIPYSSVDEKDGFFHLSTATQVLETAALHYAMHENLVAVGANPTDLGGLLKWEPSRKGALFPHYYGLLPTKVISHLVRLTKVEGGGFDVTGSEGIGEQ